MNMQTTTTHRAKTGQPLTLRRQFKERQHGEKAKHAKTSEEQQRILHAEKQMHDARVGGQTGHER